jgi:hypothetical protein
MTHHVRSAVSSRPRPPTRRPVQMARVLLAVVLALATAVTVAGPARSAPPTDEPGSAVLVEWNQIALRTVYAENGTSVPRGALPLAFVQLAVYDAVVAVEGGYTAFLPQPRAKARASSEVAAATAAHRVLTHLFPASAAALDADYAATMAEQPMGVGRVHGVRAGEAAAAAMIASRVGDGRDAQVSLPLDPDPAAGVWQPTPPGFAPMAFAELGFVRPLVLVSPTAVALPGPDDLSSAAYTADYAEVKALGAATGSSRSPAQTATGLFWNANAFQQYYLAMGAEVLERDLGIAEGARAFAMLGAATGDAAIACWRAKYDHAYWRPLTAIRLGDTDDNPDTEPDAEWASLATNPPYPDYPSGHGCASGAVSGTFGHVFGDGSIDIDVPFPPDAAIPSRHFDTTAELDAETMDARILLGLHFRRAMTDANGLGHAVADLVEPRFEPLD